VLKALIDSRSEDVRFFFGGPAVLVPSSCRSALGGALLSGTGYPEPGGLRGNGSVLAARVSSRWFVCCIRAVRWGSTSVDGEAKDWSEETVVRLDCEHRSGEGDGDGGGDSSYVSAACASTHWAVRSSAREKPGKLNCCSVSMGE